jgi:hypothetical protein
MISVQESADWPRFSRVGKGNGRFTQEAARTAAVTVVIETPILVASMGVFAPAIGAVLVFRSAAGICASNKEVLSASRRINISHSSEVHMAHSQYLKKLRRAQEMIVSDADIVRGSPIYCGRAFPSNMGTGLTTTVVEVMQETGSYVPSMPFQNNQRNKGHNDCRRVRPMVSSGGSGRRRGRSSQGRREHPPSKSLATIAGQWRENAAAGR